MSTSTNPEAKSLTITDTVRKMQPEFALLLKTSGTDPDKFMNNALLAINDKPEIKSGEVDRRSVFTVCSRAANLGVVLDGNEAALVIGSVKRGGQWVKEAQFRLMSGGVMKMINRSVDIERVACQLVYENDDFVVDFVSDNGPIKHTLTPDALRRGRGEVVGVYFVAKLKNGEWTSPEVMSVEEVNAVRDAFAQKNKDGEHSKMWRDSWGEAARKTVLHRAKKRLPLTDRAQEALREDAEEEFDVIDHTTGEITKPEPKKRAGGKAAALVKESVEAEPPVEENFTEAEYTVERDTETTELPI